MERRSFPIGLLFLRLGLGGVFLVAGVIKAGAPTDFYHDIQSFRLVSGIPAWALAFYLPWLEILCGAFLVAGRWVRPAAFLIGGMSLVFLGAILLAWGRGLDIQCGCFGFEKTGAGYGWLVFRDVALAVGGFSLWRTEVGKRR